MNTNTIAMYGDVRPVDVLSGRATDVAVLCVADAPVFPVWRERVIGGDVAPITAPITGKHKSTGVSVPGCRGIT